MRYFFDDPPVEPTHLCDHPGCLEEGLYKAPKSRDNLRDYYHFCLEHVRDYNKGWNYFADFDENAMYDQIRQDVSWERPTWPSGISPVMENRLRKAANFWGANLKMEKEAPPPPTMKTPIRDAFTTLGLTFDVDFISVKQQFRKLVKKYHPDTRPDDPKATERFKTINAAYVILKGYFSDGQKPS
jgi:hypothetical protein